MRIEVAGDKLPLICEYIRERTDAVFDASLAQGFAIINDNGKFCGAVVVANMRSHYGRPVDCEIACASETPLAWTQPVISTVFRYIFVQLKCVRVTAIARKNNSKVRNFMERLNFVLEGNVRKGYDGEKDALIYGLLAEDCRLLEA